MAAVKDGGSIESTLGAVVAHPIRVQVLTILTERVASPKQLADELGVPIGHTSYHTRVLRELELIEVVREGQVRGAVQHFYRAVVRPKFTDAEWTALSIDERRPTSTYLLQLALADAAAALEAGTLDARPDRYLTRMPGLVDQEGWDELNELHGSLLDRTLQIQAASAERMARNPGGAQIPITSVGMFFERAVRPAD
jgi:DNA-binding transcriptional ArsR family regulator